jgi:hypothetical protein
MEEFANLGDISTKTTDMETFFCIFVEKILICIHRMSLAVALVNK